MPVLGTASPAFRAAKSRLLLLLPPLAALRRGSGAAGDSGERHLAALRQRHVVARPRCRRHANDTQASETISGSSDDVADGVWLLLSARCRLLLPVVCKLSSQAAVTCLQDIVCPVLPQCGQCQMSSAARCPCGLLRDVVCCQMYSDVVNWQMSFTSAICHLLPDVVCNGCIAMFSDKLCHIHML